MYKDDDGEFTVYQEMKQKKKSKEIVELAKKLPRKKGNKHYKVGYALERDVKIALEQEGFTVFRSAGSHSFADLIAIKADSSSFGIDEIDYHPEVKLIQCKRHKNLMTRNELKTFEKQCSDLECGAVIAWRDRGIHMEEIKK